MPVSKEASCLLLLVLLITSCAPAAPVASPKSATPVSTDGTVSRAAPGSPTPAAKAASEPRYGGTLTIAIKTATPHFDMLQETGGMVQLPLAPSYNLLIQHDPLKDFSISGDLARSWDISPDGLAYTFRLNEGVKFHNGRPLTAESVRFNMDRIVNPPKGTLSPRKELYRNIQNMEAPNATTLKLTLREPQASFLALAALPYNFISDPEIIKQKGDMKRDVMGSGPFRMKDFVYSVSFTAERNADYFVKGRPYLDRLVFYTITDEMTRSAAMRTKQVQILPLYGAVSTSASLQMQTSDKGIVLQKRVTPGPNTLVPNLKVAPWSDLRVRQALNLAMDRDAASKAVRDFYPSYDFMLPDTPWGLPKEELASLPGNRQPKDQDIAEAKRLLAQAGYADGLEAPLLTPSPVYSREFAQIAQAQLAKIGIKTTLQLVETAAWKKSVYDGAFTLAAMSDASAIDDPDILLGEYYLTGSPKNYGGWSNQKFDELYALQSNTMDQAKRREMVWEMQRILLKEMPRVGVLWSTFYAASWSEVRNWSQGRSFFLGNQLQDVWLAK
ncbi:MAG: ABC transporter substrate-binding protein [Chloroflexi bacterium]|nr:ABC transporter substrate-binding protein [Chloroflexota bacterium]